MKKPIKHNIKTKKVKKENKKNEDDVWNMIKMEEEKCSRKQKKEFTLEESDEDELQCIYEKDNIHETNNCDLCKSMLYIGDEGFLFCSNSKCGKMYKDIIDFGAEWRYYSADDAIHLTLHDVACQSIHF